MQVADKPGAKAATKRRAAKPALPDRRAIEQHLAALGPKKAQIALRKAQNIMYDAWEQSTAQAQAKRAHKALGASPLCADAYNLLAGQASTPKQALKRFAIGLEAGELALGPEGFKENDGAFWRILETRPYMRARAGLALTLIKLGRDDEAIGHLQAMLRLNPNDNQGMRYVLLGVLMRRDDIPAAKALLARYPDEWSVRWLYTRALIAFREGRGDHPETRMLVQNAHESNKHVAGIFAGKDVAVFSRNPFVAVGSSEEATDHLREFGTAWRKTPGAVAWLISTVASFGTERSDPQPD
jgi:tetratricopeptide (TPR) repeat protein